MFLHGYLSCGDSFNYQKDFFSRDFNVFCPDMKGFGKNLGMEKPYSLDDYARDILEYVKQNELNRPHVIAHSFGARVAIKILSIYPDAFDKLVITGGAGLKPRRTLKKVVKGAMFKALKPFVKRERLKRFYSSDYLALSSVMKESFCKIVAEHLDDRLCKIKNPTLLVYGEKDKETPLYMARRFNKGIKNSKLIIIKGAGHFAFIDKPFKFNMEVKEFLLSKRNVSD